MVGAVVGLGDPVMDVIVYVSPAFLASFDGGQAGGCVPVSAEEMARLLAAATKAQTPMRVPGGSAANVLKGLAGISGESRPCKFMGMLGRDATGREYRRRLAQQGVQPLLRESTAEDCAPSATCLCFVTPDGQRTMRTCLGASLHLQSASQLPREWATGAALLHCEGYCLYRPQLARRAMEAARKAGALVSLDLSSFELVQHCWQPLLALLQAKLVDVVFANEEEALALLQQVEQEGTHTQQADKDAPDTASKVEAAQRFVLRHAHICVVSLGARGCVARSSGGEVAVSPAAQVAVVDTIGAGDCFTSGFLHAYLEGCDLQACAAAGCAAGAEAVQTKGAELDDTARRRLRRTIAQLIANARAAGTQGEAGSAPAPAAGNAASAVAATAAAKRRPRVPATMPPWEEVPPWVCVQEYAAYLRDGYCRTQ